MSAKDYSLALSFLGNAYITKVLNEGVMSTDRKQLNDDEMVGFIIEFLKKKMGDSDKVALCQNGQQVLLVVLAEGDES